MFRKDEKTRQGWRGPNCSFPLPKCFMVVEKVALRFFLDVYSRKLGGTGVKSQLGKSQLVKRKKKRKKNIKITMGK